MQKNTFKSISNNSINSTFLKFGLTAVLFIVFISQSFSQYTVNQIAATPPFTVLPVSPAVPSRVNLFATTPANQADGVVSVALPFTFNFYGVNHNSANISMNGFMTFGSTVPALTNYSPISSTASYDGAISAYGSDLDLTAASLSVNNVSHFTTGSAPNRIFKTEWRVARSTASGAYVATDTNSMVFQVWLYETSNVIEMHYNPYNPSATAVRFGEIGLRGATNSIYNNLTYTTTTASWPALPATMAAGTSNADKVVTNRIGLANFILSASNRTFRWTPVTCIAPSGQVVPPVSITSNSATFNWTAPAPAPALGYEYYLSTSAVAPNAATVATGTAATPTVALSLAAGQLYYVYVRSVCSGSDKSAWTSAVSFTTLCTPLNVPYYTGFEDPSVIVPVAAPHHAPTLEPCLSRQNLGTANNWVISNVNYGIYNNLVGTDNILMYNGSGAGAAANAWFFTQGINLTAGTTYYIYYTYGGDDDPGIQNRMEVAYGSAPFGASMTNFLDNHPDIKTASNANYVNFTATATGVFYFGFRAYSNAPPNNGQMFVDDISIDVSTCLRSTGVSVSSISATTAFINWTAPSPAPIDGYAYYVSSTNTPPTNSQTPTGFTSSGVTNINLTGLTGSSNYCFWVRGNCGFGSFGEWVPLNNAGSPCFTTLVAPPAYCIPSGATFAQDPNGITNVNMGSINNTTGIELNNYGNYTSFITNVSEGPAINCAITFATGFTYDTTIWVDWNNDGDFADAGELEFQGVTAAAAPSTIIGNVTVPTGQALGPRRMRIGGIDFGPLTDPCRNGQWQAFEDYTLNVVVPPLPLTLSSNSITLCAGTNSPTVTITTPLANYDEYSITPTTYTGTAATGYIFNTTTTTTYTITGVQTSAPFSVNTATFTYTANQLPTDIVITTPSGTVACPPSPTTVAIPLVASGGIVAGFPILSENFNGATNTWTVTNNGGAPATNWDLAPNGTAGSIGGILNSNDSSQFYYADSDAGGFGSITSTFLTSPAFSTVGYTQAALNFWHRYFHLTGDTAKVQISTNGTTWTDLTTYTSSQGANNLFSNVIIPLNAYLGQATVYIRFRYDATWGWFWALDNVLVSGSANSDVVWSPATGLYTNPAATPGFAYVANTPAATVYALPTANTTYTASASTFAPVCTTTQTVNVTVATVNTGTMSANQSICNGFASDITISGFTGTITGWQYAGNAGFTVGINTIAASASATLTAAQIGLLAGNRYFRAIVNDGTCSAYSSVVSVLFNTTQWNGPGGLWTNGVPDATKRAIFNFAYTSTGDITACTVRVNTGINVVFNPNHTLTVSNQVNVNGTGTLTFENNSSLVQVNPVNVLTPNTGNIIYKRNTTGVRRNDYTYWSSPVTPQIILNVSPLTQLSRFHRYDENIQNWVNVVPSTQLMTAGEGYIFRAPITYDLVTPAVYPATFTGVPNNGTIVTNMITSAGPTKDVFVGNPYPSAIDADLFLSDSFNDSKIGGIIYLWTHNTIYNGSNYINDYALYNFTGGVGTAASTAGVNTSVPNGNIAAGQSFFIESTMPFNTTDQLQFTNSMRIPGNNDQFFRYGAKTVNNRTTAALEKHRVWLEVINTVTNDYKQTLVGYIENATNDYDTNFDGVTLDVGNRVIVYSLLNDKKLGIQGKALPFDVSDIVPLGFKSTVVGNYEFRIADFDGLFNNQDIYIEDTYLNVIHNIKTSNYSFVSNIGTFEDRFILRFTNQEALSNNTTIFNDNSVVIIKQNEDLAINSLNTTIDKVEVFDIRGSQLFTKNNINKNNFTISNLSTSEQVLLVRVISVDGKVVNKKIIF